MTVVRWEGVPDAVRADVEPTLTRWLPFLPGWVEMIVMQWETEEHKNYSLACTVHPEYRKANVHIYAGHLSDPPAARLNCVLHELVHIPLESMRDAFWDLVVATTEEGDPLRKWAQEQWRKAMEGAVCDITAGVLRLVEPS